MTTNVGTRLHKNLIRVAIRECAHSLRWSLNRTTTPKPGERSIFRLLRGDIWWQRKEGAGRLIVATMQLISSGLNGIAQTIV